MTKFLIILILLFLILVLLARRYRREIHAARYVWRWHKKKRSASAPPKKQIAKTENLDDTQLVRCAKCGTWTPRKTNLSLRSNVFYCSSTCVENTVVK